MKRKFSLKNLPIKFKFILVYVLLVLIPTFSLGISMSLMNSNNIINSTQATLQTNVELQSSGVDTIVTNINSYANILINNIGYNKTFSNNITLMSAEDETTAEKARENMRIALTGKGSDIGDSISGTIDYFKTSDGALYDIRIYSPYVSEPFETILDAISSDELKSIYTYINNHTGENYWVIKDNYLYVYRALVNFAVDNMEDINIVGMICLQVHKNSVVSPLNANYNNNGYVLSFQDGKIISSRKVENSAIEDEIQKIVAKKEFKEGSIHDNSKFLTTKILNNKWVLLSYIDNDSISSALISSRMLVYGITILAFIITTIAAYFASNYISKRIIHLKKGAEEISSGNYNYELDTSSYDEIGLVSSSFNEMAGKVRQTLQDMIDTQDAISTSFAEILESKSGQSGNHVKRVAEYTAILARKLNYTENEVHDISIASMLHDVGKIMIPNSILDKPGRLTDEEFEVMRQHVVYGESMLKGVKGTIMQLGADIAGCHHERWDGTGYIKHLKGEEIPRHARIVSVADVFDALVSVRSYKKAWTFEDARAEILSQRGRQFDPAVVDAFEETFDQIVQVAKKYSDNKK